VKLRIDSALLALGLVVLLSGTSVAAPLLTAGVQDLQGVLVTDRGFFELVIGADSFAVQRVPVTGDREVLAKLTTVAVAPRAEVSSYASCPTFWVHGSLSYGFTGWLLMADDVKPAFAAASPGPGLDAARFAAAKAAFRAALMRTPSDKVTAALTVLERARVLDAALEAALDARTDPR
jgi:hypothetical protein